MPLFGHKKEMHVDLGDLEKEKERLAEFLQEHLKVSINQSGNKLTVDAEKLSLPEVAQSVNKFIYHRKLNSTHYVFAAGSTVEIKRFEHNKKQKEKHHDKEPRHQTASQSWGL
jgi:hypothetical protein